MIAYSPKIMNQEELQDDPKVQPQQLQQQPLKSKRKKYKSFPKILFVIVNISLSCLYFGYIIVYLNVIDFTAVMNIFDIQMKKSTAEGLLTFCVPIGGLFGSLSSSYFISKLSRRHTLLIINGVAFFLGILLYFAGFKVYMLIRFLQGVCAGIISAIVPLIIKQITPFQLSGFFGVFQQIFIVLGILIAFFLSFILGLITGDQTGYSYWKISFGFPLITILIQSCLLMTCYNFQPPKYLIDKNREDEARTIIQKFYYEQAVDDVIRDYKADSVNRSSTVSDSNDEVDSEQLSITKKVSIHLSVLQQMVGISTVNAFGRELAQGSLSSIKPVFPTLLNFIQVLFACLSTFILTKYGRKTILLFGTAGSAVTNLIIAIGFWIQQSHPTIALVLILIAIFYFMANFNISLGPVVWLYIPEIVNPSFLPFSTMTNWGCSALTVLLFPIIKDHLPGSNPAPMFLFFGFWSLVAFFVNKKYLVQTKDKTARQIKEAFARLQNKKVRM